MPSKLIQSRNRGVNLEKLSPSEAVFVRELLADDMWRPFVAAKKAGYKNPAQAAFQLMRRPSVANALGKEQRRRLERLELKADEVLNMLATALFFNPLSLFDVDESGNWIIRDLKEIPDEIGRCISFIKAKTKEFIDEDGNVHKETVFEIRFLNKEKLLELSMKHLGLTNESKVPDSNVNVNIGLSGGLNQLLMNVEQTRAKQVIDDQVIEGKVIAQSAQ